MITDPNDQCCQVPQCQPTNPSTNPNATIITGVPGTITGSNLPNPNPGSQPITGTRSKFIIDKLIEQVYTDIISNISL